MAKSTGSVKWFDATKGYAPSISAPSPSVPRGISQQLDRLLGNGSESHGAAGSASSPRQTAARTSSSTRCVRVAHRSALPCTPMRACAPMGFLDGKRQILRELDAASVRCASRWFRTPFIGSGVPAEGRVRPGARGSAQRCSSHGSRAFCGSALRLQPSRISILAAALIRKTGSGAAALLCAFFTAGLAAARARCAQQGSSFAAGRGVSSQHIVVEWPVFIRPFPLRGIRCPRSALRQVAFGSAAHPGRGLARCCC